MADHRHIRERIINTVMKISVSSSEIFSKKIYRTSVYFQKFVGWMVGSGLMALLAQKGYIVPRIIQN